eukprot:1199416-Alexandrium_andersonii.AAC.1
MARRRECLMQPPCRGPITRVYGCMVAGVLWHRSALEWCGRIRSAVATVTPGFSPATAKALEPDA